MHNSSLYRHYETQPLQLECTHNQSDICTVEPNIIRVREDLPLQQQSRTHHESENIVSFTILPINSSRSSLQELSDHLSISLSGENIIQIYNNNNIDI